MADFNYDIVKEYGVLTKSNKGWTKELNLISWNGRDPKFDLRDWAPEHSKMGKGLTLSKEDLIELRELLNNMDL